MTEQQKQEAQLSLRKQLNFPYLLANQIITFQRSTLAQEYSEKEIIEAIKGFIFLIPTAWKDEEFKKEEKEATVNAKIDKRPVVAGRTRIDEETCSLLGIEPYEYKEKIDYYKMFQACINLLNRRGLLMKMDPTQELSHLELEELAEDEVRKSSL